MVTMADPFKTAPEEVIRYFEAKGSQPVFDWRDIAFEEHAHTFTVAKTAGFDVLSDLQDAVGEAIKNQQSYETFVQNIKPTLQKKGWWGRQFAEDPKGGNPRISQLGSPRRLRTIYWGNISTARAAGEWERTQRTKKFMPFLRYGRSRSENRRLDHARFEGLILPVDHPLWAKIYPPNGWGCQCPIRQLTRSQAEGQGYDPSFEPPELEMRRWFDKRNGTWHDVPVGIDPGWAQNPGLNRQMNAANFLGDRLSLMPENARSAAIKDIIGSAPFRYALENRDAKNMILPIAPVIAALKNQIPTKAQHVLLSSSSARHILDEHAKRGLTKDQFAVAADVLSRPSILKVSGNSIQILGIVNGLGWRAVVKILKSEAYLTSLHRKSTKYVEGQINSHEGRHPFVSPNKNSSK